MRVFLEPLKESSLGLREGFINHVTFFTLDRRSLYQRSLMWPPVL